MKRYVILSTALVLICVFGAVRAGTLTFDDRTDGAIPNGYGGFNWNNFWTTAGSNYVPANGFTNGTVTSPNVAFNLNGNPATVGTGGTPFNFVSAYLTGAWRSGLNVEVQGFVGGLGGTMTYDRTVATTTSPTLFTFNFNNIDTLKFLSSGGTSVFTSGDGTQFAMDNFTTTPEPASLTLLGVGLAGMIFYGLRKRKRLASSAF
jgi:hypothetical protein